MDISSKITKDEFKASFGRHIEITLHIDCKDVSIAAGPGEVCKQHITFLVKPSEGAEVVIGFLKDAGFDSIAFLPRNNCAINQDPANYLNESFGDYWRIIEHSIRNYYKALDDDYLCKLGVANYAELCKNTNLMHCCNLLNNKVVLENSSIKFVLEFDYKEDVIYNSEIYNATMA